MRNILLAVFLCANCFISASFATNNDRKLSELSSTEIDALENRANIFRTQFFQKDYSSAIEGFDELISSTLTVSTPLYLLELSSTHLANGDTAQARSNLLEAESMLRSFYDEDSEASALSLWGGESEKVYKGDPYERSMLYIYLGLLLLENNDIDNALASFKSAQLADADANDAGYGSDFGLAQFLEAYCYKLLGELDSYEILLEKTGHSFKYSHPINRLVVNKATETDDNLEDVDLEYLSPLKKEFNTLLLIANGKAPIKKRFGEYGEIRAIIKDPIRGVSRFEVLVDDRKWVDGIRGLADINYQATTRDGRVMDNVLESQATFKKVGYSVGRVLIDSADDVMLNGGIYGPIVGLGMLAVGGIVHGVASAVNSAADIRAWRLLPRELVVAPLYLAPGVHNLKIDGFDGLIKKGSYLVKVNIPSDKKTNIILFTPNY